MLGRCFGENVFNGTGALINNRKLKKIVILVVPYCLLAG